MTGSRRSWTPCAWCCAGRWIGGGPRGLEIAARLYLFWERRGHLAEGRRWIGRLLPLAHVSSAADRARASYVDGSLARRQGDFAAASASIEAALGVFRELDDRAAVCDACYILGDIAMAQRDVAAAQDHFEECLTIARALDDPHRLGTALNALGIVARWRHRLDEARAYAEEVLALHRALGNTSNLAIAANNLAMIESLAGNLPAARAGLEEAVALALRLGNTAHVAFFLGSLAGVARRQGDLAAARRHADEALRLAREVGNRPAASQAYATLAAVARERGDLAAARRLARENLDLVHDLDDIRCTLPALWEAAACVTVDQPETAARLFGAAAALRDGAGYPLPEQAERELRDRMATLSTSMGETAFAAAWAEGAAMSAEQAIAHALVAWAPAGSAAP